MDNMENKDLSNYELGEELAKEALKQWKELSDEERKEIKEEVDVHHGEIGVSSILLGELLKRMDDEKANDLGEVLEVFGAHLAIDDIQDFNEWFDWNFSEE